MGERPLVIYHANCWDGFCAAWIAKKVLGDIEAFPANYGTEPPEVDDRDVYVLDFSYSRERMAGMRQYAKSLLVLDHHKTAQTELAGFPGAIFDMDKSGARLTWEHFQGDAPSPWLVDYTEDRDLWRHKLLETEAVNAALRSYPLDFALWNSFEYQDPLRTFAPEGKAIRRREQQIVADHVRNAVPAPTFLPQASDVLAVNATVLFSEIAGELAKGRPFGACYFTRKDGKTQWSLRSDECGVDVSAIAKQFGGGGHVHAAGFEL